MIVIQNWIKTALLLSLIYNTAQAQEVLFEDDFEAGSDEWIPLSPGYMAVLEEPGTKNHVLQLTPRTRGFSHAILDRDLPGPDVRMEGRFLFPTQGDGYLGFIYNHLSETERTDFGCLYVKSNGSYVRISPHHDGNPSWRLYEEMKVDLAGERKIHPGRWYDFRLDVHGQSATLYIANLEQPVASFDAAPNASGRLGLEARPGRGEPVWVDDIVVSALPAQQVLLPAKPPVSQLVDWSFLPAAEETGITLTDTPDLPESGWQPLLPDWRGAIITGRHTQSNSGDKSLLWLRTAFDAGEKPRAAWLSLSTANRIDVWLNGYYRGTAAPDRFIWGDHLTSIEHPAAKLPLAPSPGRNELILRVDGDRFAGGGFFADIVYPANGE